MKISRALAAGLVLALGFGSLGTGPRVALPTFVAIGGALKDDNEAIYQRLLTRTDTDKIVIVPYASADAEAAAKSTIERFKKFRPKARYVVLPDPTKDEASKKLAMEWIGHADLVYFTGGDQSRLIPRFYDEGHPNGVLEALRAGMLKWDTRVGGTSAGCACLSDPMFTGGGSETALGGAAAKEGGAEEKEGEPAPKDAAVGGPRIGRGLGLIPDVIMDSHFAQRGRIGRMVAALEKSGVRYGVGVNENRAVEFAGSVFRAIGDEAAIVVDVKDLKREGLSRTGIRVHLLSDGAEFSTMPGASGFAVRSTATKPGRETDSETLLKDLPVPGGAWEKGTIPNLIRRLAAHPSVPQHARSDGFEIMLSADASTSFSWREGEAGSLSAGNVRLDIREGRAKPDAPATPSASRGARSDLLIVAPAAFADALKPFVDAKSAQMGVQLETLERILKSSRGGDDAEKLKRFLYAAWSKSQTRYVLLVGDADVLPVRYMVLDRVTPAAFDYAFYPSDLYYADVAKPDGSFDDWNGAKDGFHVKYFGEVRGEKNKSDPMNYDAISYVPELAVGRWPVSTPEEVKAVAEKSLAWERAVRDGKVPARVAMVATGGWVDARGLMNESGALLKGWTVDHRFYKDGGSSGGDPGPEQAEVVKLLNTGEALVLHAGHGADDRWEGSLGAGAIKQLTNNPVCPVMMSAGCSTARFATLPPYEAYEDAAGKEHKGTNAGEVFTAPPPPPSCYARGPHNMTGLGEMLVRAPGAGAVAYIGCNTGSQPCGLTLMRGFVETLATQEQPRVGDCWRGAVAFYYEHEHLAMLKPTEDWYPASIYFQGMKFMLFGDPTAPLPSIQREPRDPR